MKLVITLLCLALLTCTDTANLGEGAGAKLSSATPPPNPAPAASQNALTPEPTWPDSLAGLPIATYLTGQFDPANNPTFKRVPSQYTDGRAHLLHEETLAAFKKMHAAAAQNGISLTIVSATRNFDRQRQIWEAKWRGDRLLEGRDNATTIYPDPADRARAILRYSSMPGTSRHHWGTDLDLNALTNGYFASGEGKRTYDWLAANGPTYGFCQPYTAKGSERPEGYEEEKWHWSYTPLASQLTDFAAAELRNAAIGGFAGAEAAGAIDVVGNYVLGVNRACR